MRVLIAAIVFFAGAGFALAGEKSTPAQKTCPISGKPVNGAHYVDVDGFRIQVAGAAEAAKVRENPNKAFAALAKKREAAEPVVWMCPSMERPVDRRYPFIQQAGKRIYYCCGPCQPRIKKDFKSAAAKMKSLAGQ